MSIARRARHDIATPQVRGLHLVGPPLPQPEAYMTELRAIHALLVALGRVCGMADTLSETGGRGVVAWGDPDFAYFEIDTPGEEPPELDVSVAAGRIFVRVARPACT